jgi:Domain of unknown function (DUF4365)
VGWCDVMLGAASRPVGGSTGSYTPRMSRWEQHLLGSERVAPRRGRASERPPQKPVRQSYCGSHRELARTHTCISYRRPMAGPYALSTHRSETFPLDFADGTAPANRYKEWFSWSVVASIVSSAGLVCQIPTIDANKVDVRVESWGTWRGKVRHVGLQLKSTSSPSFVGGAEDRRLAYQLDGPDYNELVEDCSYPRFLIVVALPTLGEAWVRQRSSIIALSAGAWWTRVSGPPTAQGSKTVHLPAAQRFDVDGLHSMLAASG